jgi:ketosteroid isomerase-like protein
METLEKRLAAIENRLALEALNSAFCRHLDHGELTPLLDLFCDDAVYSHGTRRSQGREAIAALFHARQAAGTRTSRHLQFGLRLTIIDHDHATGESVCLTFAADQTPPIIPAAPHLVADFRDTYKRCRDGRWRLSSRHIERIFVAADNPGPVGGAEPSLSCPRR